MTFNDRGQPVTFRNAEDEQIQIRYDSRGNLLEIEDALGAVTRYQHNSSGDLSQITNAEGEVKRFEYDGRGNLTKVIDSLGREMTYTYDGMGNRLSQERTRLLPDGSVETLQSSFTYDALDRPLAVTSADGSTESVTYDALGRRDTRTDRLGRVTRYEYDERGRLGRVERPDGATVGWTYDAEDRLTSRTDAEGQVTTFVHDAVGNVVEVHHPDGAIARQELDAAGRIVARIDPRGSRTEFTYDALGRQTSFRQPLGHRTTLAYDAVGRITSITDAKGEETQFEYDAQGNLLRSVLADGAATTTTYDAVGRPVREVDAEGAAVEYAYDALGRLTSVTDALGHSTSLSYDALDRLVSQTDALGRTTSFEYDTVGRLTSRTLPDGARDQRVWRADGSLESYTDFMGATTSYEYDGAGRQIRRSYADGSTVETTYAADGMRSSVTDSRGTASYTYDSRNRLVAMQDANGYQLSYGYDASGNQTQMTATTSGLSLTTSMAYDAEDRLIALTDPSGGEYSFAYDVKGNLLTQTFPNGVITTSTYDALDRPTSVVTQNAAGDLLESFVYSLDDNGRRARVEELGGNSVEYVYDALYRLTQEEVRHGNGDLLHRASYAYDAVGNRTQQTLVDALGNVETTEFAYDDRDRLLQETPGVAYTWDANGNLVGEGDAMVYSWDLDQRLSRAVALDGTTTDLTRDADGYLVQTSTAGEGELPTVKNLLVDIGMAVGDTASDPLKSYETARSQVIAEVDSDGEFDTFFVRGGGQLLGLIRPAAGEQRYYHSDALGSIRSLSDEAANLTDQYDYTAFGETLDVAGSDENPFRFAGEFLLPELSFYDLRARFLSPRMGRFLSMDSFAGRLDDPISLHRYQYADLDPVNLTDPNGLFSVAEVSIVSSIRSILSSIQIDVGLSILTQPALDPDGDISKVFLLLSLATGGVGLVKSVASLVKGSFGFLKRAGGAATAHGRKVLQSIRERLSGAFRSGARSCSCFAAGTEVKTDQGLLAIELLEVGDLVWARDDESGEEGWKPVEAIFVNKKELLELTVSSTDDDREVFLVTSEHPLWVIDETDEGWKNAADLEAGDRLWSLSGAVVIESVTWTGIQDTVYNVEVDAYHTYFVGDGGLWAHNSCRTRGWSSAAVNQAARLLEAGEREVYVKTAEEAAELFIGVFQSRGSGPNGRAWKNTTGISKQETRNLHGTTNGTYHWDTGFDSDGVLLGHKANNPHSHTEHLQVHDFDGTIYHIFFRE